MQTNPFHPAVRPECFLAYGAGWIPPTPEEIRAVIGVTGFTGSQIARLTGVKDSRQVRRWLGGDAQISFAVWAIIVETAGIGKIWSI